MIARWILKSQKGINTTFHVKRMPEKYIRYNIFFAGTPKLKLLVLKFIICSSYQTPIFFSIGEKECEKSELRNKRY